MKFLTLSFLFLATTLRAATLPGFRVFQGGVAKFKGVVEPAVIATPSANAKVVPLVALLGQLTLITNAQTRVYVPAGRLME